MALGSMGLGLGLGRRRRRGCPVRGVFPSSGYKDYFAAYLDAFELGVFSLAHEVVHILLKLALWGIHGSTGVSGNGVVEVW